MDNVLSGLHKSGVMGVNITYPYKVIAAKLAYNNDELVVQSGAANLLKRTNKGYMAYNTDIIGIEKVLFVNGIDISDSNVLILGAGGAAGAAAVVAARYNCSKLFIANRNMGKAINLAQRINQYYNVKIEVIDLKDIANIPDISLVMQTTSVGLYSSSESIITERDLFKKAKSVFDMIYNPAQTLFLNIARLSGCFCINGFEMLFYQAMYSLELWFELKIDNDKMERLKNELYSYYIKQI